MKGNKFTAALGAIAIIGGIMAIIFATSASQMKITDLFGRVNSSELGTQVVLYGLSGALESLAIISGVAWLATCAIIYALRELFQPALLTSKAGAETSESDSKE